MGLLPQSQRQRTAGYERLPAAAAPPSPQQPQQPSAPVDLGPAFLRRLWRLLRRVHAAAPALALVALAVAETVIVSKLGTITALFYQVFVDGQASKVPHLLLWSAGCYAATALFYSAKAALQDVLAWRWRAALTADIQQLYCSSAGACCSETRSPLLQALDNPDQRVAQDLPLLTASLAEVITQLAAVPLNIAWYTHLTQQIFRSWLPVAAAYAFFVLGAGLQRLAMLPVAACVFQQEAAEGCFRFGHMRFRAHASDIALSRSHAAEHQHLQHQLRRVLACQGRLLLRRAVLTASSRLLEYGGLLVNFGCLAGAVFSWAWAAEGQSAGDLASRVSVASFYLLTLIYNFTQVLDLASKVSNLAGLTARVSQLLEALSSSSSQQQSPRKQQQQQQPHLVGTSSSSQAALQPLLLVGEGAAPSLHKRFGGQAVLLQAPRLMLVGGGGAHDVMQASIHSLSFSGDMLLRVVRQAFPDSPRLAPLLAVVTFQFCGAARATMLGKLQQQQQQVEAAGVLGRPQVAASSSEGLAAAASAGSSTSTSSCCPECHATAASDAAGLCTGAAMQHMLDIFVQWQQAVCDHIEHRGYWCDAADPRTGRALHGTPGSAYDEVTGAAVLLGYTKRQPPGQQLALISHPDAHTQVYPATLFTSAPLPVVREALAAAAAAAAPGSTPPSPQQPVPVPGSSGSSHAKPPAAEQQASSVAPVLPPSCALPLLSCSGLSVSTPAGVAVVQGLSLQLAAGGSLLIQGPSGCGKSTLLSCLAGLWPADAGSFGLVAGAGGDAPCPAVMFLPQRPLAAPGSSLRAQLVYPCTIAAGGGEWACRCSWQPDVDAEQLQRRRRQQWWQSLGRRWQAWLSCGLACEQPPAAGPPHVQPHSKPEHSRQHLCQACQQLCAALQSAGLAYLLHALPRRLHTHAEDWAAVLSPGELQRLAVARLLLHRPLLAVLDEGTSSLPDAAAVELYQQLQAAGISCVSVGHSSCLVPLHTQVLRLAGDGGGAWTLTGAGA